MDELMLEAENHLRDIQSRLPQLDTLSRTSINSIPNQTTSQDDAFQQLQTYLVQTFEEVTKIMTRAEKMIDNTRSRTLSTTVPHFAQKMRIDQLKYDTRHMRASMDHIMSEASARERVCRERETLLATKFVANDHNNLNSTSFHHRSCGHESINMGAAQEHEGHRLKDSSKQVDTLLDAGRNVMEGLRNQRSLLRKSQKRLMDIINSLGLSNSVMRIIERRTAQDKVILYGGMAVTTVLIFIILVYLR